MSESDVTTGELTRQIKELSLSFAQHRLETAANYHALSTKFDIVAEVKVRISRAELDIDRLGTKLDSKHSSIEREIERVETAMNLTVQRRETETNEAIERLDQKVNTVTTRAAQISGGISFLGFVLAMVSWLWKSHP